MPNISTIGERITVLEGVSPQDITTDRTGDYHDVSGAERFRAVLVTAAATDTKNATIELLQATDDQGADSKELKAAVETVADGNVALQAEVEARASDLDDDFAFVAVKVTSDDTSALQGAAVLILADQDYGA